jgi:hypothetical protein
VLASAVDLLTLSYGPYELSRANLTLLTLLILLNMLNLLTLLTLLALLTLLNLPTLFYEPYECC